MDKMKKDQKTATPEMVNRFIEEYYAADSERMDLLLNNFTELNKPEINIEQIVSDILADRNEMVKNVRQYEDELVRLVDLSTVLSEWGSETEGGSREQYINYLLEKNKEILPDIIEIIQFLKK